MVKKTAFILSVLILAIASAFFFHLKNDSMDETFLQKYGFPLSEIEKAISAASTSEELDESLHRLNSLFDEQADYAQLSYDSPSPERNYPYTQGYPPISINDRLGLIKLIESKINVQNISEFEHSAPSVLVALAGKDKKTVDRAFDAIWNIAALDEHFASPSYKAINVLAFHNVRLLPETFRKASNHPKFSHAVYALIEKVDDPEMISGWMTQMKPNLSKSHAYLEHITYVKSYFLGKISFEELDAILTAYNRPEVLITRELVTLHHSGDTQALNDRLRILLNPSATIHKADFANGFFEQLVKFSSAPLKGYESLLVVLLQADGSDTAKLMSSFLHYQPSRNLELFPLLNAALEKKSAVSASHIFHVFSEFAQIDESNPDRVYQLLENAMQNPEAHNIETVGLVLKNLLKSYPEFISEKSNAILEEVKANNQRSTLKFQHIRALENPDDAFAMLETADLKEAEEILVSYFQRGSFVPDESSLRKLIGYSNRLGTETPLETKLRSRVRSIYSEHKKLSPELIRDVVLPELFRQIDTDSDAETVAGRVVHVLRDDKDIIEFNYRSIAQKVYANPDNNRYMHIGSKLLERLEKHQVKGPDVEELKRFLNSHTDNTAVLLDLGRQALLAPEKAIPVIKGKRKKFANAAEGFEGDFKRLYDEMYLIAKHFHQKDSAALKNQFISLLYYSPKKLYRSSDSLAREMLLTASSAFPELGKEVTDKISQDLAAGNRKAYFALPAAAAAYPSAIAPFFTYYPELIKAFGTKYPYANIMVMENPALIPPVLDGIIPIIERNGLALIDVMEGDHFSQAKFWREHTMIMTEAWNLKAFAQRADKEGLPMPLKHIEAIFETPSAHTEAYMDYALGFHCDGNNRNTLIALDKLETHQNPAIAAFARQRKERCF